MRWLIACVILILLTGCAHKLTKNECVKKDSLNLGKNYAYKGFKLSIFERIQNSCREHGVEMKRAAFKKGWHEGMKDFCTSQRGFHWGFTEKDDPKICIEELRPAFEQGYSRGKKIARSRGGNRKG